MQEVVFWSLALVAVATAITMVLNKNPVYSVLSLILTLFALAGMYVLLNASFIAAVHMIVYAGAIMVLFLFVVMLLDLKEDIEHMNLRRMSRIIALLAAAVFVGEIAYLTYLSFSGQGIALGIGKGIAGDVTSIGTLLFTKYLLPFEVASVLLLAAIIGAIILARRKSPSAEVS